MHFQLSLLEIHQVRAHASRCYMQLTQTNHTHKFQCSTGGAIPTCSL